MSTVASLGRRSRERVRGLLQAAATEADDARHAILDGADVELGVDAARHVVFRVRVAGEMEERNEGGNSIGDENMRILPWGKIYS